MLHNTCDLETSWAANSIKHDTYNYVPTIKGIDYRVRERCNETHCNMRGITWNVSGGHETQVTLCCVGGLEFSDYLITGK